MLAIGTVVDDAIVVVEAVMAKMESGISDAREATRQAMSDVSVAVISCTLVFMAVFIPVAFMPGTSGSFFTQFGVTLASSVGLSCVSALTLCPALCAIMMRYSKSNKEKKDLNYYVTQAYTASYNAILKKYKKSVVRFINRPVISAILLAITAVLLVIFMRGLPSGLVPQEDQACSSPRFALLKAVPCMRPKKLSRRLRKKSRRFPNWRVMPWSVAMA